MASPVEAEPIGQQSSISSLQESHVNTNAEDIPKPAYCQPAELILHRPDGGKVSKEVISIHLFGDQTCPSPQKGGVSDIPNVVRMLENADIPCCIGAEAALIYYGTRRHSREWFICVPTNMFEKAVDLVRASEKFEPFVVPALDSRYELSDIFPRFKFVNVNLLFRIVPGRLYLLDVKPENIERSHSGLPYPKLPHFVQGLLDTYNGIDLDDVVDGMNLSLEWGDENLNLEGKISVEWDLWRTDTIARCKTWPGKFHGYNRNDLTRREVWLSTADPEKKRRRKGLKYSDELYDTRFRRKGSRDPRSYQRDWV